MVLESKVAVQSCVYKEYSSGDRTQPWGAPVLRVREDEVWLPTFRPQVVKVGNHTSSSLTLNTGAPQGCVLSPLLYSLYTHDCTASFDSTTIVKFADDTAVIGLITNNDERAYLEEVRLLTQWCQENNLHLNVSKMEMLVDFGRKQDCLMVFCECTGNVESETIPPEVKPVCGNGIWKLVVPGDEMDRSESFEEKLSKLLEKEGKTMGDIQALGSGTSHATSPESIIRAVGELLEKNVKPSISGLAIWGLSETCYPYKGYVVVDMEFPKDMCGVQETIAVLALVCPDPRSPDQVPVIIGTNASLFKRLAELSTVLAHLYATDTVTVAQRTDPLKSEEVIDPDLFDFGDSPIPGPWKKRLSHKLAERRNAFSLHEWDVGLAKNVEHHIRLSDARPFRERSRRLAPADIDDVRRHLQGLLAAGILKESRSPYASPIVVARKRNGSVRMCIDYRTLNSRTIPDQYTMPRLDDALDCLSGSKWFSVLDLRSGYYQIAMADEDKDKTAFICPLGFYQFERMPQGITGAPATFQRLMERAVGDMHLLQVLVYLDDIIVFGKTLEEHEERLLKVLDRLEEVGLKVSIDKCQFCQPQVKYVGHIVSEFGIATDPEKVEVVTHWKRPTDLKSLRSFLGFCGYYRRFIANYSAIVRPLTELTKGYPPVQHARTAVTGKTKFYFKESEPFGERWDPTCTAAFQKIINCLTNSPVLAFADPTQPYVLHVDASMDGLGAVLNQEYPEGLRPVAFASRKLSASEQRYPIHQLEFLALKWAVVDKFHDYLYGARFTVRTDNNPLTYVLTTAKLNATGHRWLAALATYDFSVQYRPGKHNIDADLLSRNPHCKKTEGEWMDIPQPGIKALCKQVSISESSEVPTRLVDQLGASPGAIPDVYAFPTCLEGRYLDQLDKRELQKAQEQDPVIGIVRREVEADGGSVPKRPVTRGQTVQKQRRKELRENSPNEQGGVTTESEDEETYQHNHLDLDEVRRQVQEFSEQPENIITVEKESEVVNEDEHHSSHEDPELEEATLLEGAETEHACLLSVQPVRLACCDSWRYAELGIERLAPVTLRKPSPAETVDA
ncbi:hypothetical protein SKAU_G00295060 [Synaphobranchus kaupii]|uniref:ribonuclease H n=1 Tax=Synaphobranchus kaupii TaxID=118154 RepID=A0A9Q1IMP1_SYNKA|nr:hypothetical protein SKAU_G00295060 [Synaphobranchus kaupii]